jgi:serine/threonine protein kinase
MELLQDVQDLEEFVVAKHREVRPTDLIVWLRDILSGLSYLASQQIIHCDIKPGNILIAPHRPALIADLGYAKHWPRPSSAARVTEIPLEVSGGSIHITPPAA